MRAEIERMREELDTQTRKVGDLMEIAITFDLFRRQIRAIEAKGLQWDITVRPR